ncbi:hypothetical protein DICPUDRAFT_151319 [Dictyostelium purpureum]|uniref:alanine--tRNA ligase n=1 Tax=Dictyostelium purpureum TaxID=5786 RepID=F0ZIJ7_DICPU|nr:uncharacterized protein DICPUDRAFT_151319 [Dictyostelium purpureum]EGC36227.1 hypothetical protein DICPUDRAFT_151319 [Dictyostelium purpureum]|eukprot:XP_003287236.1 hypothetical protein DICPUDRAFT_151319 [Dictyostelium purpureum]
MRKFLNYFETNKRKRLPSSSLIPHNDSTLLFTNAGMVQFKNQFTALEESKYKLVTTSQKCVRAGGNQNDLENVGYTARHHTFFEMLDSIQQAWNLLTKDFGLPKERLAISVLEGDEGEVKLGFQMIKLSIPCVDTGLGLERMATVLQEKTTNYDIDLFQNLINSFKEQVMIDPPKAFIQCFIL